MISIQLSEQEAELFKDFCRIYKNYQILENQGFWGAQKVTLAVSFNSAGTVTFVNFPRLTNHR